MKVSLLCNNQLIIYNNAGVMYKTLQLKSRWACWLWWWFFEVWNLRFCNSGFAAKFTVKRECLQKFALCCGLQQKLTKYLLRSSEVTSFKDLRKGNWSNRSLTNWIDNHLQLKLRWAYRPWWFFEVWNLHFSDPGFATKFTEKRMSGEN